MSARKGGQDGLLKDLRKQVTLLENDLRARSESVEEYRDRLTDEYTRAYSADRTAATYESWRDERVTQVAAAWVLGCVFVRFCEDNGLIERAWLAGVGERLKDAEDHDAAFFAANPEKNDRDWIVAAFDHLAGTNPTVAGLFDRGHNPLWEIAPSYEAATALLKFWRRVDSDGELIHSFVSSELDTRFLGDLYQDLSEHARKTYALLQTPVFVEELILDLTLEPAVEEFGLEPIVKIRDGHGVDRELPAGLRTIDPACGSGHFLLGLFERLLAKWRVKDKSADEWILIRRALNAVHGCDKNPLAVSIARFRLVVAVLKASRVKRLDTLLGFPIHVAVGDSLLHGREAGAVDDGLFSSRGQFLYRTEDIGDFIEHCDLLGRGSYHVVVGNPPYITVKDKQEKENYAKAYFACSGNYALSVPFAQRIFELARRAGGSNSDGGFTGQITANSFMKREFGKTLIEAFFHGGRQYTYKDAKGRTRKGVFAGVDLTHIVDTSGAYIPGHGTPTVILAGRNQMARQTDPIRTILGIRGEPGYPDDPATGNVWKAIKRQIKKDFSESEWIASLNAPRERFRDFPWSLQGGGAHELMDRLESACASPLGKQVRLIGRTAHTGADEAYFAATDTWIRRGVAGECIVPLVEGTVIRDWELNPETESVFPYGSDLTADDSDTAVRRHLWLHRSHLRLRREPGGVHEDIGLTWYEWSRWHPERFIVPLGIAFPFVATHNHFALDRGGNVFKQTAPVIKLPEGTSEEAHLILLRVLNSSTACFWLKQVSQSKGNGGIGGGISDEPWEHRYEFTGTKLQEFPLPVQLPLHLGRTLDTLAQELATHQPSAVCTADEPPTRTHLDAAHEAWTRTRQRMIALQEELDWEVYHSYGLLTDAEKSRLTDPSPAPTTIPQVKLGERAFEIVLARKQAAGEIETAWFDRHGSTPVTEIPAHWPDWYQDIVQARIDTITSRRDIALIERPECKRRWATDTWEKREKAALRTWLLDKCEDKSLWFHVLNDFEQPRTLTVGQLADELEKQADANAILNAASLYAAHLGKPNLSLTQVLQDVVDAEHVPYLAAYRYKDTGLRKHAQWEDVWEQQREEDRTGERLDIPVPPKYTSADFLKQSYWSNRGKLDVPKERFVSYPDASPGSDPTLLLGWAGWDQRDQATALLNIVSERRKQQDWSGEQLIPLLAGINELMPWLRQWFGEVDDEWGEESAAEEFQSFLDGELARDQLTPAALTEWRPAKKTRARKATATAKTAKKKAAEDDE
ncbi:BREX-2 system adenine-specific DNA-methyltransferase PglX [Streptomyces sp. Isolate_219]|uniref:BREX-2 system adenine-specific DNA-methyltransferase PglX n=1 Tax=Streptomyces sp. Isolate_219 TaxID=2950110 RepID=UPI0021C6A400|nr:BREX-2 system adenine-specific DNA-methyltransferase PglX [Streptomyces sp. Isolate_219]MCR8573216.1 BREX-2 system adenine-specific DNA-methyltransferase PglX [Streptomyces sp. Isolate_219]